MVAMEPGSGAPRVAAPLGHPARAGGGPTGTYLNRRRLVGGEVQLADGDLIAVGPLSFQVTLERTTADISERRGEEFHPNTPAAVFLTPRRETPFFPSEKETLSDPSFSESWSGRKRPDSHEILSP